MIATGPTAWQELCRSAMWQGNGLGGGFLALYCTCAMCSLGCPSAGVLYIDAYHRPLISTPGLSRGRITTPKRFRFLGDIACEATA